MAHKFPFLVRMDPESLITFLRLTAFLCTDLTVRLLILIALVRMTDVSVLLEAMPMHGLAKILHLGVEVEAGVQLAVLAPLLLGG